MRTDVLVTRADLEGLRGRSAARLVDQEGHGLPVVVDTGGGKGAWDESAVEALEAIQGTVTAVRVVDALGARRAERRLWASMTSASDGWVDRVFNRPVGRPLSKLLIHTPVTPNQISVAATVLGVLAAAGFATGQGFLAIWAAVVFQISAVVDCVDGDVARVVFKESKLGKWLDLVGDQVVHTAIFLGIAWGEMVRGSGYLALSLGLIAAVGALVSFAMVLWAQRRAAAGKGGGGRLSGWLEAATNRDFSVVVLVLAVVERLDLFLWMAALGSQVFWILVWWAQVRERPVEGEVT
jgi:phosphatidylglycerophosphate synthase